MYEKKKETELSSPVEIVLRDVSDGARLEAYSIWSRVAYSDTYIRT